MYTHKSNSQCTFIDLSPFVDVVTNVFYRWQLAKEAYDSKKSLITMKTMHNQQKPSMKYTRGETHFIQWYDYL